MNLFLTILAVGILLTTFLVLYGLIQQSKRRERQKTYRELEAHSNAVACRIREQEGRKKAIVEDALQIVNGRETASTVAERIVQAGFYMPGLRLVPKPDEENPCSNS